MGRDVSMAWLSDSYDEIVDSLGEAGSNAGGGGFARLASTIIGKLIVLSMYSKSFSVCHVWNDLVDNPRRKEVLGLCIK